MVPGHLLVAALLVSLCLMSPAPGVHAQTPAEEETQDIQQMMEEALKDLSPEERAQMEALMAQEAAQPVDDVATGAPARSPALDELSREPLDDEDLRDHVQSVWEKIQELLPSPAVQRAAQMEQRLRTAPDPVEAMRAAASGLAMHGAWPEATWMFGRVSLITGNMQDLNNWAALLTMEGGPISALPILWTLEARFPDNSTVQNNIGQALYTLGDAEGAEQALRRAVATSPDHPQANATIGLIETARGDMSAAQASTLRALRGGYSASKAGALRRAGGTLTAADLRSLGRAPSHAGRQGGEPPLLPTSFSTLSAAREAFREWSEAGHAESARANAQLAPLTSMSDTDQMKAAAASGGFPFFDRAQLEVGAVNEAFNAESERHGQRSVELLKMRMAAGEKMDARMREIRAAGQLRYKDAPGGFQDEYVCPDLVQAVDSYLATVSPPINAEHLDWLERKRRFTNELAYLWQFLIEPARYTPWEQSISGGHVEAPEFQWPEELAVCRKAASSHPRGKLATYEKMHCDYRSRLDIPLIGSMQFDCTSSSATFAPEFSPFEAAWTLDAAGTRVLRASVAVSVEGVKVGGKTAFDDKGFKEGSLTVGRAMDGAEVGGRLDFDDKGVKGGGISLGADWKLDPGLPDGPLQIDTTVALTTALEFDRSGLSDVTFATNVKSAAVGEMGASEEQPGKLQGGVESSVNGTWSWNAGYTGEISAGMKGEMF